MKESLYTRLFSVFAVRILSMQRNAIQLYSIYRRDHDDDDCDFVMGRMTSL